MQPTKDQVDRSMQALRAPRTAEAPLAATAAVPDDGVIDDGAIDDRATRDRATRDIANLPAIRADRVAQAREFLASGDELTSEELAEKVVGRLVCDRLR